MPDDQIPNQCDKKKKGSRGERKEQEKLRIANLNPRQSRLTHPQSAQKRSPTAPSHPRPSPRQHSPPPRTRVKRHDMAPATDLASKLDSILLSHLQQRRSHHPVRGDDAARKRALLALVQASDAGGREAVVDRLGGNGVLGALAVAAGRFGRGLVVHLGPDQTVERLDEVNLDALDGGLAELEVVVVRDLVDGGLVGGDGGEGHDVLGVNVDVVRLVLKGKHLVLADARLGEVLGVLCHVEQGVEALAQGLAGEHGDGPLVAVREDDGPRHGGDPDGVLELAEPEARGGAGGTGGALQRDAGGFGGRPQEEAVDAVGPRGGFGEVEEGGAEEVGERGAGEHGGVAESDEAVEGGGHDEGRVVDDLGLAVREVLLELSELEDGKGLDVAGETFGNVGSAHADPTEQVGEEDEALGLVRDAGRIVLRETRELYGTHGDGSATSARGGGGCGSHCKWLGDGRRRVGGGRRCRRVGKVGFARTGGSGVGRRLGRKTDADGKELASSQEDNVVFMLGFRWRHDHEVGIVKPIMMETVLLEVTRALSAHV